MILSSSRYQVPLAVPYWGNETYRAILGCFVSGRIVDGPDLSDLRSLVIDQLGVADAILCSSGSLALQAALQVCDVRAGDEVIVPAFCCTSVVMPILAVGACPVLVDSGEELNMTPATVQEALSNKTRAIIVPHLFGNPADIDLIIDLAADREIRVIDDAAQALGATIDGRPLGTFGDAGILSFGNEKICFGLGGGALVWRRETVRRSSAVKMVAPQLFPTLQKLSSTVLWRRWGRWSRPLGALFSRARAADPETPPEPYRNEAMSNLNAAVASSLMRTLPENITARRARVRSYRNLLSSEEGLILVPHRAGSACLTQLVRVAPTINHDDVAADLIRVLRGAGYEVQGSYIPIHLLPAYQHLARKSLSRAEAIWADLIELPCEPDVSMDHVERIASIVKQVIRSRRAGDSAAIERRRRSQAKETSDKEIG